MMFNLNDFADFIKKYEFDRLVTNYLNNIHSFNIAFNKFSKQPDAQKINSQLKIDLEDLVNGFIENTELAVVKAKLHIWKQTKLQDNNYNEVEFTDLLKFINAQKQAFINLIPSYTTDASQILNVVMALDLFYNKVNELAYNSIKEIEINERKIRLETEEKYHDLFDNASDLVHLCNPDCSILYVNRAWSETLGYTKNELIGTSLYDYMHPSEVKSYKIYRQAILDGQEDKVGRTVIFKTKQGKEVITEGFVSCKFDNNKVLYSRAILRNVTEKKLQEARLNFYNQQLLEREENLAQLIKNAPDAIIVISQDHEILLWNPKAEAIFGWTSEEVTGKFLPNVIIPPDLRKLHMQGMDRFLKTGESKVLNKTIEVLGIKKSGESIYISLTISKSTREGKMIFISFLRDISIQKNNEIELERKRLQLEHTIKELEQYAWLTSHDLKEPLRKIIIFCDSIIHKYKPQLPEAVMGYLEKINRSAHRMDHLIEAILLYSNVSDDKSLYKSTDLNAVVDEVLEDIEVMVKSSNAQINIGHLPVIDAIPVQMHQLFQNLLINAIKYQQPGASPVINIASQITGDHYQISIQDNGLGFENIYATKIFDVFQRLSHKNTYEGTGIGLALCKKIVEAHNGRIYANSKINEGSVFYIELPLDK